MQAGAIRPLCDLVRCSDARTVTPALDALCGIMEAGQVVGRGPGGGDGGDGDGGGDGDNPYAALVEEAGGLENIEDSQDHPNPEVYAKSVHILETFFRADD